VRPFLRYTVLRLGLFVLALAVFALLGAGGWLLVLLAAVTSLALSLVLLRGPRDELSAVLASRADPARRGQRRFERGLSEDAAAEDAAVEQAAADQPRADRRPDPARTDQQRPTEERPG
jgi:hypothetical protein